MFDNRLFQMDLRDKMLIEDKDIFHKQIKIGCNPEIYSFYSKFRTIQGAGIELLYD